MSKHTLGPWEVLRCSDKVHPHQIEDADGTPVARAITARDARLIAAAPDLLSALEMARALMVVSDGYDITGPSIRVIDAAIAKATGEQP